MIPSFLEHFLHLASGKSDLVFLLIHCLLLTPLLIPPSEPGLSVGMSKTQTSAPFSSPSTWFPLLISSSPVAWQTSCTLMTPIYFSIPDLFSEPHTYLTKCLLAVFICLSKVCQVSYVQNRALPSYLFPSCTLKICSSSILLHISKWQHCHPVAQSKHLGIILVFSFPCCPIFFPSACSSNWWTLMIQVPPPSQSHHLI